MRRQYWSENQASINAKELIKVPIHLEKSVEMDLNARDRRISNFGNKHSNRHVPFRGYPNQMRGKY